MRVVAAPGQSQTTLSSCSRVKESFYFQLIQVQAELLKLSYSNADFYVTDINSLIQRKGLSQTRDASMYVNADLHYALDFQSDLAFQVVGMISSFAGTFKKCLILDLDNTLWGGIIGDDG